MPRQSRPDHPRESEARSQALAARRFARMTPKRARGCNAHFRRRRRADASRRAARACAGVRLPGLDGAQTGSPRTRRFGDMKRRRSARDRVPDARRRRDADRLGLLRPHAHVGRSCGATCASISGRTEQPHDPEDDDDHACGSALSRCPRAGLRELAGARRRSPPRCRRRRRSRRKPWPSTRSTSRRRRTMPRDRATGTRSETLIRERRRPGSCAQRADD